MRKNTKALDKLVANLRKMNGMKVEWGFFQGDKHPDPRGIDEISEIAKLVENGHENGGIFAGTSTPPRPFFATSVNDQENKRQIRALIKKLQRQVLQGKLSPEEKMNRIGRLLVSQLQDSIVNFTGRPLQQSTLDLREWRGNSSLEPLIETGAMLSSVKFQITRVNE